LRYTYYKRTYIAKQCKNATADLTSTTHGTIMEEVWSMLVMNCTWIIRELTSPGLFDAVQREKVLTVTLLGITEGMPQNFGPQDPKKKDTGYCA
jgi:hypothetical protein